MQMNHPISGEELMAYLDGELPVERSAIAIAHLEHCKDCQSLAADFESVSRQLYGWTVDSPAPEMARALREALSEARPPKQQQPRPMLWGLMGAAAIIVCLVFVPIAKHRIASQSIVVDGTPLPDHRNGAIGGKVADSFEPAPLPPKAQPAAPAPLPAGPLIVRTADLTLTTNNFNNTRQTVEAILRRHDGYFAQLTVTNPPDEGRSLTATLRVPAAQLDSFLAEVKKLGRVDSESQSGNEVTSNYIDLEARLSNARKTEQRLTEILSQRTGKLSDVLAVEEELGRVRGEIESMEAEQKNLSNQIALATVQFRLVEQYKARLDTSHSSTLIQLHNAAVEGYRVVIDGAIATLLFLLSYGPALVIVAAILFFPVRFVWRRTRPRSIG